MANSYLGLLALLFVPLGSCVTWVGVLILVGTTTVRVSAGADLRFRAATDKLPVVGRRVEVLWILLLADGALAIV